MGARNCFYLRERNTQGGWRREERSDTGALSFSLPTGPFFLLWKERLSLTSMAEFSETKVWKKYSRFSPFFLGRKLKLTERDWLWMPLRELNNQSTPSPSPSQPVFICWHMPKASFCPWCTFSPRLSSLALYTCMTICYVNKYTCYACGNKITTFCIYFHLWDYTRSTPTACDLDREPSEWGCPKLSVRK